jgi:hypothetical protein
MHRAAVTNNDCDLERGAALHCSSRRSDVEGRQPYGGRVHRGAQVQIWRQAVNRFRLAGSRHKHRRSDSPDFELSDPHLTLPSFVAGPEEMPVIVSVTPPSVFYVASE